VKEQMKTQNKGDGMKAGIIELLKGKTFKASIVAILVGMSVSLGAAALSQPHKSFLWKVQSNTATVCLLGSVHFLKADAYPLNRAVENAYEMSDTLVVEANVNDLGNLNLTAFMDRAFYQGENTIQKHVTSETYRLIRKESAVLGLPMAIIDMQKPWFLALYFQAMELMRRGYDPTYGVDNYFLSKAAGEKRVLELEGLEEQIDLLAGLPDVEQETFLVYTLENLKSMGPRVDAMVRAWAAGDTAAMESSLNEGFRESGALSTVSRKLIDHRNKKIASRIEAYLASEGNYLVIVGAAHLVGKKGIVELLRNSGYRVEQQ